VVRPNEEAILPDEVEPAWVKADSAMACGKALEERTTGARRILTASRTGLCMHRCSRGADSIPKHDIVGIDTQRAGSKRKPPAKPLPRLCGTILKAGKEWSGYKHHLSVVNSTSTI